MNVEQWQKIICDGIIRSCAAAVKFLVPSVLENLDFTLPTRFPWEELATFQAIFMLVC